MANNQYEDLFKDEKPEVCQACGGSLTFEKVNLEDYQGGRLYIMEKVPAFVCENCGEVWLPEPVMLDFEKMIETVKQKKRNKPKTKKPKHKKK